jgi:hypothetical protein
MLASGSLVSIADIDTRTDPQGPDLGDRGASVRKYRDATLLAGLAVLSPRDGWLSLRKSKSFSKCLRQVSSVSIILRAGRWRTGLSSKFCRVTPTLSCNNAERYKPRRTALKLRGRNAVLAGILQVSGERSPCIENVAICESGARDGDVPRASCRISLTPSLSVEKLIGVSFSCDLSIHLTRPKCPPKGVS